MRPRGQPGDYVARSLHGVPGGRFGQRTCKLRMAQHAIAGGHFKVTPEPVEQVLRLRQFGGRRFENDLGGVVRRECCLVARHGWQLLLLGFVAHLARFAKAACIFLTKGHPKVRLIVALRHLSGQIPYLRTSAGQ
jgi:hypothetical protein